MNEKSAAKKIFSEVAKEKKYEKKAVASCPLCGETKGVIASIDRVKSTITCNKCQGVVDICTNEVRKPPQKKIKKAA